MSKAISFSFFLGLLCTVANQAVSALAKYALLQIASPSEPLPSYTLTVIGASGYFTLAVWIFIIGILYKARVINFFRSLLIVSLLELCWLILTAHAAMFPLAGMLFKMK